MYDDPRLLTHPFRQISASLLFAGLGICFCPSGSRYRIPSLRQMIYGPHIIMILGRFPFRTSSVVDFASVHHVFSGFQVQQTLSNSSVRFISSGMGYWTFRQTFEPVGPFDFAARRLTHELLNTSEAVLLFIRQLSVYGIDCCPSKMCGYCIVGLCI